VKRRAEGVTDTTINRELSKVSQPFKVGKRLGKIDYAPLGGCDFMKDPECKNTQLVRLPDRYFGFFAILSIQRSGVSLLSMADGRINFSGLPGNR
jgi:hypothetical protein